MKIEHLPEPVTELVSVPQAPVMTREHMMQAIEEGVTALASHGRMEAVASLGFLALAIDPLDPRSDWWTGLGMEATGRVEEAQLAFETAIQKDPKCAPAHVALGLLHLKEGRAREALPFLQMGMTLVPHEHRPLQGFMLCLLALGDLERGWRLYSHRNRFPRVDAMINKYDANTSGVLPWWDGRSKCNVLFIGEEGPGERIMFASMIQDAVANGASPTIEMVGKMASFANVFRRSFPYCLIGVEGNYPASAKLNIGDLGGFFRRSFGEFPKHTGYLKADRKRTLEYRKRLSPSPVVGISWKSTGPSGVEKSIPLQDFNAVFRHYNMTYLDLQYGETQEERDQFAPTLTHLPDLVHDIDNADDMDGLFSAVAACDLVITCSNMTAHVAGSLGVPVWLLAPRSRGLMWFWFLDRSDSPWYPSMKIWRQTKAGWGPLLEEVGEALGKYEWPEWKTDNTA